MNTDENATDSQHSWTFLSNYAHVLVCLNNDPVSRLRDIAQQVGITERAVQRIISELEQADIITRIRDGRRNRYELHLDHPLRHPLEAHRNIGDLLALVNTSTTKK